MQRAKGALRQLLIVLTRPSRVGVGNVKSPHLLYELLASSHRRTVGFDEPAGSLTKHVLEGALIQPVKEGIHFRSKLLSVVGLGLAGSFNESLAHCQEKL